MDRQGSNVPDLAAVLKTLSGHAPAQASTADSTSPNCYTTPHGPSPGWPATEPPTANSPPPTQNNKDSLPDASLITAWPAALKYVMKSVGQNETLQSRIRRLIQTQHDHERQWWEARETLLAKQKTRAEKKKKLDEVLRSVGGLIAASEEVTTPEDDLLEVGNYDKKIYRALSEMSKALDSELRGLDVPFFAIRRDLVLPSRISTIDDAMPSQQPGIRNKAAISTDELAALQRRMLDLLEDMCKES